jgi:serine/threonine protein kinase
MIGRTVGNYRIVRELGQGAMGAVYEAMDVMVERRVAIKMLRAEIARQPDLIERFRVEAVTLARLNHPSTALLYNFFREGDDYYMVMEFVPGRTLDAIVRQSGKLHPAAAANILRQVLEGMAHAHRMGVLHRDIKPANIMVTGEGQVKVTDFGIARVLGSSRMTREGRIIGTLEYIAPERIRGHEADIRSDLYSCGVVLFEMLSGRLPFVADTDFGLMQAHLEQQPPELSGLGVASPPQMEAVVRKALAKAPEARFQSAEEFRDAVVAAAPAPSVTATRQVSAPVAPTRLATPLEPTRLATPPGAPAPAPSGGGQGKWLAIAAAVVVVLIVAAALGFWIHKQGNGGGAGKTDTAAQPSPMVSQTPLPAGLSGASAPSGGSRTLEQILSEGKAVPVEAAKPPRRQESQAQAPAPPLQNAQDEQRRNAARRALEGEPAKSQEERRNDSLRALDK